jgi:dTDP-4-dehydrorhamnose reductase
VNEPRVAVTGAGGQLGTQVVRAFEAAGWEALALTRSDLDIGHTVQLERIRTSVPAVVVNCAAWTDVDGCARDPERAMAINGTAAGLVAEAAADVHALAVQISTNEVFDGARGDPYAEDDEPAPINAYGASKLAGERSVAASNPRYLVIRTAWIFGPGGRNFPSKILAVARERAALGDSIRVVADEIGNPTWAPDLAQGILASVTAVLAGALAPGTLHVAGMPPVSRFEWAQLVLAETQHVEVVPISIADYPRPSRVPPRAVLATERASTLGIRPSDWRTATVRYAQDLATLPAA